MPVERLKAVSEPSEEGNGLTIEQLAAETGMTVRNIRSHRARGLLPPPEVRERVGYYGADHVARLRVIQDLQAEGFNLQGIKRLLDRTAGGSERLLNMKAVLSEPFEREEPQIFSAEELAERFGAEGAPDLLRAAEKVGALVPLGDGRYEAPAPSLIDVAEEVMKRGITIDHAIVVIGKVRERCEQISKEFVRLFLEDLWKPFVDEGYPPERWNEIVESIDRLRPISSQAVHAVYGLTMSAEVERAFGKEIARMMKSKPS